MFVFNINFKIENLPVKEIIEFAETEAVTEKVLKEYLVTLLLRDNNVLSKICAQRLTPGESLRSAALADITALTEELQKPSFFDGYIPSVKRELPFREYQDSLEKITAADAPADILNGILFHYTAFGNGDTAKYLAYRWDRGLQGIAKPDDIRLSSLFCVDYQKKELTDNTISFLHGQPANNVLLYGNSGCGKSSMVKALLNEYYREGLRLVQINKDNLNELPLLLRELRDKSFRYIVFMDDLSFEEDDYNYKTLKTILDGGIEKQPSNILFYATSNRLHLVNETWEDRQGGDIHVSDTRNEKLSLSERFGIRISFLSPGQTEYLKIIEGILAENEVEFTPEIRAEALKWAAFYNGKSGRTANQFAHSITAKGI